MEDDPHNLDPRMDEKSPENVPLTTNHDHSSGVENGNSKFQMADDVADYTGVMVKDEKGASGDDDEFVRQSWGRKLEYVLSMVGFCVGLGNVWRFPYVCMRNGGGAFLIPFFLCLLTCGLPLFLLEVGMGQFIAKSSLHLFEMCPLFKGVGIAMNISALISQWYYITILAWTLVFVAHSFRDPLPWTLCGQWWNSENCVLTSGGERHTKMQEGNATLMMNNTLMVNGSDVGQIDNLTMSYNFTLANISSQANMSAAKPASAEFWLNNVLEISPGFGHMDGLVWSNCLALAVAIICVTFGIIRGIKSVGKVVYVTATLPYILITVLLIKGATLPGALDGILFYVRPDFSKLLETSTWVEASLQVFYSLGPCYGILITMASYNKFNNNCLKDSILLTLFCEGTSVYAGLAVFSVLGHMAHTLDIPVENVTKAGPGLAFVVYPEAISYLPVPQLWAVLFFIMLFTVGLDSQFVCIETVLTTAADLWPHILRRREVLFKCAFMLLMYLLSLPFVSRLK